LFRFVSYRGRAVTGRPSAFRLLFTEQKGLIVSSDSDIIQKGRHPLSKPKKKSLLFRLIRFVIWLFYPKIKVEGIENLPDEPSIIVGNHAQLHGPIAGELYLPKNTYIWCAREMMEWKEVPSYAYTDFWSQKPKLHRPFYRIVAYLITPFSVVIFNNARTIAVHKDKRILSTFKDSLTHMKEGHHVVIFPEHDVKHNHIVYDFQKGFVDLAKMYERRTGKAVPFVPMYVAPKLKRVYIGKPVIFDARASLEEERDRVCDTLMDEITRMAEALPPHTVVPYRNIPKRLYPTNVKEEEKR